jgi:hypothetical protein
MFLSRHDLAVLAQDVGIPTRVGGRRFVLEALVRSAGAEADATALTRALASFVQARRDELQWWSDALPAFAGVWRPWGRALRATQARLEGGALATGDDP